MAELTAEDVENFTRGRLQADDDEVARMLNAALVVARRYTGWHVSPIVEGDVLVLDGPGGRRLQLPTRRIIAIDSIEENGTPTAAERYAVSAEVPGLVVRRSGSWTCETSGISVTLDHGYSEEEAADWRQAILAMVDQMSQMPKSDTGSGALVRKKIDDVEYQWAETVSIAEDALFSVSYILDSYARQQVYFA